MALSLAQIARWDFLAFLQKGFEVLNPATPFEANWHIEAMSHVLTEMAEGKRQRQIIAMPPRCLKSITGSVAWPAFLLGRNPAERIVAVSYNETLAEKLSLDTRRLMESDFYRSVFPGTRLERSTRLQLVTTEGGTRFATSVGGPATGFGGDWIIVDDPMSATDAHSPTERAAVKRYFDQTLSSRLDDEARGRILLIMQRLHADDLAGHLLASGGWDELKLQAEATCDADIPLGHGRFHPVRLGDLLHSQRLPRSVLDQKRRQMGSAAYAAQCQQEPVPESGNMVKREWLRFYDILPDRSGGEVVLSLDTATKTDPANDYTVCTAWLAKDGGHYLFDLWRDKVDYPTLKRKVMELMAVHQADRLLIEDAGAGSSLIQELNSVGVPAIACKARDPKVARLAAASSNIESGLMRLPKNAHWLAEFEAELLGFPAARHDDQVDSLSQYFSWVRDKPRGFFRYDMGFDDPPDGTPTPDQLAHRRRWH